ncbi:hypothetical protein [Sphingomonas sp. MA1305]|uniref:hypothetical protein n=1 Tax=Sphingomonas sp. MA1305 TaxID=2479204 RepID=UPI001E522864|nr:hypothetical protein [Sphingomonas sp. MA1305]
MMPIPLRAAGLLTLALLATGCGHREAAVANNDAAAAAFVPPPMQKAKPLPGQAQVAPLTNYVGKYPNDAVAGVAFYDRTEVAQALVDAVADQQLRHRITSRDAVSVPIVRMADGRLAAHGCTPHDCADQNWTFLVAADGSKGEACWHDAATMGTASAWYAGSMPKRRPGDCPQA